MEDKEILHRIDLEIKKGETHVLMGPSGTGKSTLDYALMGNPRYEAMAGAIQFQGKEVAREASGKHAGEGMFLSFRNPVEVSRLTLGTFIRSAVEQYRGVRIRLWDFRKEPEKTMELLQVDQTYGDRDLNAGFSGDEKKKVETLQMLFLRPSLAVLDEMDSGLDADVARIVSQGIKEYQKDRDGGLLIIIHSTRVLGSLRVDKARIMVDGRIVKIGDASLVEQINRMGFEQFLDETDQSSLCLEGMEGSDGRKNIYR